MLDGADSSAMHGPTVAHEQDGTTQMSMHLPQELGHVARAGVVVEQVVVQSKALGPRSASKCCQGGDAVVPIPRILQRRFPARSPHAPAERLQQIAAFVEKNQASLPAEALFLAAASFRGASGRWPVRCVRGRVARVSVESSRSGAAACPHSPRGTPPQTAAGSGPAPAGSSSPTERIPSSAFRASAQSAGAFAARVLIGALDPDDISQPATAPRHASKHPSNDARTTRCIPPRQPLPSTFSPAQKAGLRSFDELPTPRESLMVSCIDCTAHTRDFFH